MASGAEPSCERASLLPPASDRFVEVIMTRNPEIQQEYAARGIQQTQNSGPGRAYLSFLADCRADIQVAGRCGRRRAAISGKVTMNPRM